MAFKYIDAKDTIRGTDGEIMFYADDQEYNFFHITQLEATASLTVDEVPRIGTRTVGHKVSTISYEGSCTGYYGDPVVRDIFLEYASGGKLPKMSIKIKNNDVDSQFGSQTILLENVMFSSVTIAQIDAGTTMLEEDFDFTFDKAIYVENDSFTDAEGLSDTLYERNN